MEKGDFMKKNSVANNMHLENGVTAILLVNVAIFMGVTLHKKYKPQLEKLTRQYVKLKNENSKDKRQNLNYKKGINELVENAKTVIGDVGNLLVETMKTYSAQDISKYSLISEKVEKMIGQKLESRKVVQSRRPETLALTSINPSITVTEIIAKEKIETMNPITSMLHGKQEDFNLLDVNSDIVTPEVMHHPIIATPFLRDLCVTLALISAFNTIATSISLQEMNNVDTAIVQDVEEFLDGIDYISKEETAEIQDWTVEKQINAILSSNHTYEAKMNQILKLPELSLEEAISTIMHLNIATYENVFNYVLSIQGLEHYKKMDYIINSSIATYEEKFHFVMNLKDIPIGQKIWHVLLIPNISFEQVWDDLLKVEDITQEQIIKSIIDADIFPFDTLFQKIENLEGITQEQLATYLVYYQATYNCVTDTEILQYILNLDFFTQEQQLDCIWAFLSKYSLNKRTTIILDYYNMTYEDYLNLYTVKSNLTEEQSIVWNLMERINAEKEIYVLEHYSFDSKEQLDETIAICAAEGHNSYEDLYWVASTVLNRSENPHYIQLYGANPYSQVTAYKQFAVYESGSYLFYLYPRGVQYEVQNNLARQAFLDVFYGGSDVTAHNFVQFRSWNTEEFSNIYIVNGGNRYGTPVDPNTQIKCENLEEQDYIDYEWVKKLSYSKK